MSLSCSASPFLDAVPLRILKELIPLARQPAGAPGPLEGVPFSPPFLFRPSLVVEEIFSLLVRW